jgi:uncharacterized protein
MALPFLYAFLQAGSILPPMISHYVWNYLNSIVLGSIYRKRGGIMNGPFS